MEVKTRKQMCTLTIYPKPQNEGFVLTFNRDETLSRSSIIIHQDKERGLVYPRDAQHGGTWLAFQPLKQRFTCLLNGAFEIHERRLPYKKSRGLVVLESFEYTEILIFCTKYDFYGIEPFTMILGEKDVLIELRWDGQERHITILDEAIPHIWSSCTLYNKEIRQLREIWFSQFLKNINYNNIYSIHEELWRFHQTPNSQTPENALLMQRPLLGVQTVSISQLNYNSLNHTIDFTYHELEKRIVTKSEFNTTESAIISA